MEVNFEGEISDTAVIVFTIVVIILLIFGIPSNTLFLWTLLKIRRLRIIHNTFVGNLAVADFLITSYLLPFNLVFLLNKGARLPDSLCRFNGMIANIVFCSSVLSVSTIAVHRYVKICHYSLCSRIYTKTSVSLIIAGVWIVGFLFSIPLLCMEDSLIFDPTMQMCVFNRYVSQSYSVAYLFVCLFLPSSVTMVCYYKIFVFIQRHKEKLKFSWNNGIGQLRFRKDVRSTKSTFVVFVLYLLMYSLFGVLATFYDEHSQIPPEVHATSVYLAYAGYL
ncbi:melatonin receptor type 1B-B-like [Saccostrea cucullata]|uniref:melatonin receptor type 1B-B-like n=1 Tax=Saccostrea cuccullata TaxID=36930 RepID=UPI002ED6B3A3